MEAGLKRRKGSYLAGALLLTAVVASAVSGYYGAMFASSQSLNMSEDDSSSQSVLLQWLVELLLLIHAATDDGSSGGDGGDIDVMTVDEMEDELNDMQYQISQLEARVLEQEENAEAVAKYSEFEIAGPVSPNRDYRLPDTFVEYRGRTTYTLSMMLRVNNLQGGWGNIIHIGDVNGNYGPGCWQWGGNSRRIRCHQNMEGRSNQLIEAPAGEAPPLGEFFKFEILAQSSSLLIKYNDKLVFSIQKDVYPLIGRHTVWFSDPWHVAALVTVKDLKFAIQ